MHYNQSLYIDSLSYTRSGYKILDSIYLDLPKNSILGLLGRNGSGKSTLLNIIFGNLKPDFAYMKCDGVKFEKGYKTNIISYLPQGQLFPYNMKVKDIIRFMPCQESYLYEIDIIQKNLNLKLYQFSAGEARVIEILLILYSNRPYLLLNEPFTKLSPILITFLKSHILLVKEMKGIIVSDHNFADVFEISDNLRLLHNSNLVKVNDFNDLTFFNYIPSHYID